MRLAPATIVLASLALTLMVGCKGNNPAASGTNTGGSSGSPAKPDAKALFSQLQGYLTLVNNTSGEMLALKDEDRALGYTSSGSALYRVRALQFTPVTPPSTASKNVENYRKLTMTNFSGGSDTSVTPNLSGGTLEFKLFDASSSVLDVAEATASYSTTYVANISNTYTSTEDEVVTQSQRRWLGSYHNVETDYMASKTTSSFQSIFGATNSVTFTPQGQTGPLAMHRYFNSNISSFNQPIGNTWTANTNMDTQLPGGGSWVFTVDATHSDIANGNYVQNYNEDGHLGGTLTPAGGGSVIVSLRYAGVYSTGLTGAPNSLSTFVGAIAYSDATGNKLTFSFNPPTVTGQTQSNIYDLVTVTGALQDGNGKQVATLSSTMDFFAYKWTGTVTFTDGSTQPVDLSGLIQAIQGTTYTSSGYGN